jgi:glutathione peroxidase
MRFTKLVAGIVAACSVGLAPALILSSCNKATIAQNPVKVPNMSDIALKTIDGKDTTLAAYKGKALLIVNTASRCGYTPQYKGLQELYDKYRDKGFEVLGFPCNDFGAQEPGTEGEIKSFCELKYKTTFPMFSKVTVKGDNKAPLYKFLTEQTGDDIKGAIKWNFTKFLISADGAVVARFEPGVDPLAAELAAAVEKALPKK